MKTFVWAEFFFSIVNVALLVLGIVLAVLLVKALIVYVRKNAK